MRAGSSAIAWGHFDRYIVIETGINGAINFTIPPAPAGSTTL
jgi:hypothetical protein